MINKFTIFISILFAIGIIVFIKVNINNRSFVENLTVEITGILFELIFIVIFYNIYLHLRKTYFLWRTHYFMTLKIFDHITEISGILINILKIDLVSSARQEEDIEINLISQYVLSRYYANIKAIKDFLENADNVLVFSEKEYLEMNDRLKLASEELLRPYSFLSQYDKYMYTFINFESIISMINQSKFQFIIAHRNYVSEILVSKSVLNLLVQHCEHTEYWFKDEILEDIALKTKVQWQGNITFSDEIGAYFWAIRERKRRKL